MTFNLSLGLEGHFLQFLASQIGLLPQSAQSRAQEAKRMILADDYARINPDAVYGEDLHRSHEPHPCDG